MYQSFLIHSSADGHLGYCHVLAIVNSAGMNIGVHVSLSVLVSSVCMSSSGIPGSYGSSISILFHFHQEALQFFFTFCHKGGVICISEVVDISPTILIPACASSSPAFLMMYSAYKLNKQSDNIQLDILIFLFETSLLSHVQF